jgi:hypothetical protein
MNTRTNSTIIHLRGLSSFAAILSIGALASDVSASTIVAEYDFTGGSAASTDVDGSTFAEDYIATVAPNTVTYSGISTGSDNAFFFSFQTASDLDNAIAEDDYHSFALDLETSGATVSLESLDFDQGFWNTNTTLDFSVSIFSSVDGFATDGELLGSYTIDGGLYENGVDATVARSVNLTGITELQDVSSDVEFRIYFYDNSSATDRTHRIDNVVLTASTVIPEPSSVALLLGVASLGSAVFMRRRKRTV